MSNLWKVSDLGAGFTRDEILKYGTVAHVSVDIDVHDRPGGAMLSKQIEAVYSFHCSLSHPNRAENHNPINEKGKRGESRLERERDEEGEGWRGRERER